jgi:hypothetical protein
MTIPINAMISRNQTENIIVNFENFENFVSKPVLQIGTHRVGGKYHCPILIMS